MHERTLVRALLRQVEALAAEHPTGRVRVVRVRIGEFSGVEPELIRSAFDDLVDGSTICGAELDVEQVPLTAACQQCGRQFAVERFRFACPICDSSRLTIQSGEEVLLESLSIEETEPCTINS